MKIAMAPTGAAGATAAMSQTKKRVSAFCRPTMMQTKASQTRIACGRTDVQFQAARSASCRATSGVKYSISGGVSGECSAAAAKGPRRRTLWFRALCRGVSRAGAGSAAAPARA